MSIYDKYHSQHNKDYMYNLIKDIVLKETRFDISNNQTYKNIYNQNYSAVFESINTDNLIDLNKELLDTQAKLFIDDITKSTNNNYPEEKHTRIEDILQDREKQNQEFKTLPSIKNDNINKLSTSLVINSLEREFDLSTNLFNFKYSCQSSQILHIQEIILPYTTSSLVSSPIIYLYYKLNNLYINHSLQLHNVIEITKYNKYLFYKPVEPITIELEKSMYFEIRNHLSQQINYNQSDYIPIQSIRLHKKELHITISHNIFMKQDFITIHKDKHTNSKLYNELYKIKDIINHKTIICDWPYETIEDFEDNLFILSGNKQVSFSCLTD